MLPRIQSPCPRCAAQDATHDAPGMSCGACQKNPPAFVATHAAFRYAAPVDKLIQDLKYNRRLELSRVLGIYLTDYLKQQEHILPDMIIPVPLHPTRLRERGYNQALEIARFVGAHFRLPVSATDVQRIRATLPQTELSREQRRKNMHGAFRARRAFTGLRIAIVDDVMTSGHTADALARCLTENGAAEVRVWVLARA
ncbi:MAG: ComF family protein [Gammaproteobacteria bacterium]|nr:ComF family protein [Gammaproteobacteria bacterium]